MSYTIFESTNMASTHYAERIFDAIATTDIENGTIGYLNGLKDGYDVVYNFVKGVKEGLEAGDIVVADNPAWDEKGVTKSDHAKDKYIIPAGTVFRVRVLKKNDEFGVSIDGFTSATQSIVKNTTNFIENNITVSVDTTTGKLVAASGASTGVFVGKVMRKRLSGGAVINSVGSTSIGKVNTIYEVRITALGSDIAASEVG